MYHMWPMMWRYHLPFVCLRWFCTFYCSKITIKPSVGKYFLRFSNRLKQVQVIMICFVHNLPLNGVGWLLSLLGLNNFTQWEITGLIFWCYIYIHMFSPIIVREQSSPQKNETPYDFFFGGRGPRSICIILRPSTSTPCAWRHAGHAGNAGGSGGGEGENEPGEGALKSLEKHRGAIFRATCWGIFWSTFSIEFFFVEMKFICFGP